MRSKKQVAGTITRKTSERTCFSLHLSGESREARVESREEETTQKTRSWTLGRGREGDTRPPLPGPPSPGGPTSTSLPLFDNSEKLSHLEHPSPFLSLSEPSPPHLTPLETNVRSRWIGQPTGAVNSPQLLLALGADPPIDFGSPVPAETAEPHPTRPGAGGGPGGRVGLVEAPSIWNRRGAGARGSKAKTRPGSQVAFLPSKRWGIKLLFCSFLHTIFHSRNLSLLSLSTRPTRG